MNVEHEAFKLVEKFKIPSCHSEFQIRNFIIGKETSPIGMLWQCIKEIQVRCDNLKVLNRDLEEIYDNLEIAKLEKEEIEIEQLEGSGRIKEILEQKQKFKIKNQQRKIEKIAESVETLLSQKQNILFEVGIFLSEFENIRKNVDYKDFNDPNAQLEYWNAKFENEMVLMKTLGNPINPEVIKSVLALPQQSELRRILENSLALQTKKLLQ